jgi:hypothetical protein
MATQLFKSFLSPVDMCGAILADEPVLFITAVDRGMLSASALYVYSLSSPYHLLDRTPGSGGLSRVSLGREDNVRLLADVLQHVIYEVEVKNRRLAALRQVADFPRDATIRCMAFDRTRQRLYYGTSSNTSISVANLANHRGEAPIAAVGNPTALALDPIERQLYVATGNQVIAIELDRPTNRQQIGPGFRELSSIALDEERRVWVADAGAGTVVGPIPGTY